MQIAAGVDTVAAVRALTRDSRGADIVIEAVATPTTWEWAVAMVRKGGAVNFFGGPPSGTVVGLDTNRLHYGDITLKASFHHTPAACAHRLRPHRAAAEFKCREYITRHRDARRSASRLRPHDDAQLGHEHPPTTSRPPSSPPGVPQ